MIMIKFLTSNIIFCLSLLILLLLIPVSTKADQVDDFIREQMRQQNIPGLSLVVVRDGKVVKAQGYGLADAEQNVSATADTVYEIGSVTKQFTATAVMMLVEENKVRLDDNISVYLYDIPAAWKTITVRQLMNQTSGLKEYFLDTPEFADSLVLIADKERILKPASSQPLDFKPGEGWNYSNTNHFLLGLIVERASGMTYADYLKTRIFQPLGMTATRVNNRKAIVPNRAKGYSYNWEKGLVENAQNVDPSWSFSAGAIVSSVNDLAKWDAALSTERLVGAASKKEMWTPGRLNTGVPHRYGFGWYVDRINGHTNLSHGGDIFGFATYFSRYPDDKLSVIVSLNQYIYPKRIADMVATMFLPALNYRPIADKEPMFTSLVQNLYANRAEGKSDLWKETLFAPEYWKSLKPSLADSGNTDFYKRLGKPQSVVLVERIEDERSVLVRYRILYGKNARIAKFVRNRDGKITEWDDYEE
jgi:CubicO group peptidase (beta-lactamase class C family)